MKKGIFNLLICFFVLGCMQKKTEKIESERYDFFPVEKKIQSWVDQGYYPGASILIAQDGKIVYEDYFGDYSMDEVVYIASAGKWLATAAIAALVDQGKLSWNDKVNKWLPAINGEKGTATIRQLLSHTSGYPDYQPQGRPRDDYQTLPEAVKNIIDLPSDTPPGTEFHYGGLAMQVAGRIAEIASGKEFEEIFQENIAVPLGMTNTHFVPVDSAEGHNPMIGEGARSTLHDYAQFLEMFSNDGMYQEKQVLSRASVLEIQSNQIRGAKIKQDGYVERVRNLDHKGIYGLGMWREELNDEGDAVLISSPGWAGAYPWIDKRNNIYGFFLTHVIPQTARRKGFSSFYSSPELVEVVRDIVHYNNQ